MPLQGSGMTWVQQQGSHEGGGSVTWVQQQGRQDVGGRVSDLGAAAGQTWMTNEHVNL